jgi:hypothetical protein
MMSAQGPFDTHPCLEHNRSAQQCLHGNLSFHIGQLQPLGLGLHEGSHTEASVPGSVELLIVAMPLHSLACDNSHELQQHITNFNTQDNSGNTTVTLT